MADDAADLGNIPWRTGRHQGRAVYAQAGGEASRSDLLIGVMDTAGLAAEAVAAHNERLAARKVSAGEH